MRTRQAARALGIAVTTALALCTTTVRAPVAAADACPDVEVVFARGTSDKPGFGPVGKQFITTLQKKLIGKKIAACAVDYSASWDFSKSTSEGAVDANKHVQYTAGVCPNTKIVLGGMSQGAGVIDLITIGKRRLWFFTPSPLPDTMVNHVAAIAVFGNPSRDFPGLGPLTTLSPLYGSRAIDLCAANDPYCSKGSDLFAHFSYLWNGMIDQAAVFAARRVLGTAT
ncbi:cutinase family protein [Mycolicibacterium psychrotolerans]|uniref:Putative cutinase n=1 Tax=Mycolicibacterium psychrotolerans TaxID=216929 RepID=A0A7I7MDL3_9MYCO|nr:cutinase family protein [Mycolicibacterium psychrotolerans]BBX70358.1 putative cutinase [Mycolicibacterium psychrotolerans]